MYSAGLVAASTPNTMVGAAAMGAVAPAWAAKIPPIATGPIAASGER